MRLTSCILVALIGLCAVSVIFAQVQDSEDQSSRQLTLWLNVKRSLDQPDGEKYFESNLKDALVPGGANGLHSLTRTVLSSEPANRPVELVLALSIATLRPMPWHRSVFLDR